MGPPPAHRRGGGGGHRGRGRGGRGGNGGGSGSGGGERGAASESGSAAAPVAVTPRAHNGGGGHRPPRAKSDKAKQASSTSHPHQHQQQQQQPRKGGGGGGGGQRGSAGGGAGGPAAGRPARAVTTVTRKVLIRNLPHDMDEEAVVEWLAAQGVGRATLWRFCAGRVRSNNRLPVPGRAYLDFKKDAEGAKALIEKLDGLMLPTSRDPVRLHVDFAPFQKVPRDKQRKDAKVGTIDRDPEFVAFLEELSKPKEKLPSADMAMDLKDLEATEKPVAALVQYLNERRRDKGKSKFGGKPAKKERGTKLKSGKEGKGTKDKIKTGKGKGKASVEGKLSTSENSKSRKPRGKAKESVSEASAEPATVVKIMSSKHLPVSDATGAENRGTEDAKPKPSKKMSRGGSRRASTVGGKEANDAKTPREDKPRPKRENRSSKSKGGRPEQVYVPKTPAQAPVG